MRYWSYNEYTEDPDANSVVTKSEAEILHEYWPHWYHMMCKKYGREHVDENYSFHDCLDDWIVVNWAWESKDD
jgi:hypothetical protein